MLIKILATLGVFAFLVSVQIQPSFADKPDRAITPTTKQYDPRLPPVIPGETVVTESGDRIKVWSSSGSPSTLPTPTPSSGGPALILDGRSQPSADGKIEMPDSGRNSSLPGFPQP